MTRQQAAMNFICAFWDIWRRYERRTYADFRVRAARPQYRIAAGLDPG